MFNEFLERKFSLSKYKRLIIKDFDKVLSRNFELLDLNKKNVIYYKDDEELRYVFEKKIKQSSEVYIIVMEEENYIPYDMLKIFFIVDFRYKNIFPKLNEKILKNTKNLDENLLTIAYQNLYDDFSDEKITSDFLKQGLFTDENIEEYIVYLNENIKKLLLNTKDFRSWFKIAEINAKIENINNIFKKNISIERSKINDEFKVFILNQYKSLANRSFKKPIILSKVMDYVLAKNEKSAIIVMDGMSISNWLLLREYFKGIEYEEYYCYAMIPTLTSISRQSLFAGDLPFRLKNPFTTNDEEKLFELKCKIYNINKSQIKYSKGYNIQYGIKERVLGIVINDIDDMVHSQLKGKYGMSLDLKYIGEEKKIQKLIKKLNKDGFNIYITSDHGNVEAKGIGNIKSSGIDVKTKSNRVIIYKWFADVENIKKNYNLIEYPGYYLNKEYQYLLAKDGDAIAQKDKIVVSHGGISIDEVIVPFIEIRGVKNE